MSTMFHDFYSLLRVATIKAKVSTKEHATVNFHLEPAAAEGLTDTHAIRPPEQSYANISIFPNDKCMELTR